MKNTHKKSTQLGAFFRFTKTYSGLPVLLRRLRFGASQPSCLPAGLADGLLDEA